MYIILVYILCSVKYKLFIKSSVTVKYISASEPDLKGFDQIAVLLCTCAKHRCCAEFCLPSENGMHPAGACTAAAKLHIRPDDFYGNIMFENVITFPFR